MVLRDDKSFPEILLRRDHPAAQMRKHRGAHTIKGDYFGPFASAWAVNRTLNTLQKAFLLRSCSDSVYDSRTRPCMLHQIKRCSAPCTGLVSLDDYAGPGRRGAGLPARQEPGGDGAHARADAGRLRRHGVRARRPPARPHPRPGLHRPGAQINAETVEEADVFALHAEGGQACVQVFFFRAGQNWGNRAYFPRVDKSDG